MEHSTLAATGPAHVQARGGGSSRRRRLGVNPDRVSPQRTPLRLAAAIFVLPLLGCGVLFSGPTRTMAQAPQSIPNYRIDEAASELRSANTTDADALKSIAVHAMQDMVATRSGSAEPARISVLLSAADGVSSAGVACCVLVTPLMIGAFGMIYSFCTVGEATANVELKFDIANKHYAGRASAASNVTGDPDPTDVRRQWDIVVYNAVQEAVMNAKEVQ